MSNSLRPHGLQHTRPPCPSPSPGVCWDSGPLSWWCHLTSHPLASPSPAFSLSFPASRSFLRSWVFTSGGQSIGASALTSVLPMNEHSELIPLRMDWFDLLSGQGTLKSLLQNHNLKASVLWCSAFFMVQLLHLYMTTGKIDSFDYMDLGTQVYTFLY